MPKISIIIPVYNVEGYLSECLNSIQQQTYTDYEVILVEGGSTDKSGIICCSYAHKDKRFIVVHHDWQGVGNARNVGLDAVKGEYIAFIDGDDIVSINYLSILYESLVNNNCELSCCSYLTFYDDESIDFVEQDSVTSVTSGRDLLINIYYNTIIPVALWGKLYKKELFNNIRFPKLEIAEDNAVNPIIIYNVENAYISTSKLYGYRRRKGSLMMSSFSIKNYDSIDAFDNCIEYFKSKKDNELIEIVEKKKILSLYHYSYQAKDEGFYSSLPRRYKISELYALYYLRKHLPDSQYTYQLAKHHPKWIIIHEYIRKIKKMMGIVVPK